MASLATQPYKSFKFFKLSNVHKISRLSNSVLQIGNLTNFIMLFSYLVPICWLSQGNSAGVPVSWSRLSDCTLQHYPSPELESNPCPSVHLSDTLPLSYLETRGKLGNCNIPPAYCCLNYSIAAKCPDTHRRKKAFPSPPPPPLNIVAQRFGQGAKRGTGAGESDINMLRPTMRLWKNKLPTLHYGHICH